MSQTVTVVWIAAAFASLIAVDLVLRLVYLRTLLPLFETKPPFQPARPIASGHADPVEFLSTDHLTIRGSHFRHRHERPRGLILFCPELDSSHGSAWNYCEGLFHAGFDILSFDFRNQGESDRLYGFEPLHWLTRAESEDVVSALEYIESRPELASLPLGVFGVSRGSTAALMAAARFPHIEAVVCDSGYSTSELMYYFVDRWATQHMPSLLRAILPEWHLRSTLTLARWASQIRRRCRYLIIESWFPRLKGCPILFIAGERDNYVPPLIGRKLARLIPGTGTRLVSFPKAKHNRARQVDQAAYDQVVIEHFKQMPLPLTASPSQPAEQTISHCA